MGRRLLGSYLANSFYLFLAIPFPWFVAWLKVCDRERRRRTPRRRPRRARCTLLRRLVQTLHKPQQADSSSTCQREQGSPRYSHSPSKRCAPPHPFHWARLMGEVDTQGKKLVLTEAERLQRREETARRRKRQSEQRLQDEQVGDASSLSPSYPPPHTRFHRPHQLSIYFTSKQV